MVTDSESQRARAADHKAEKQTGDDDLENSEDVFSGIEQVRDSEYGGSEKGGGPEANSS